MLAAEMLERDARTNEFYGACTALQNDSCSELKGAVLRLQQGFSADYSRPEGRRQDLRYYRSIVGWHK